MLFKKQSNKSYPFTGEPRILSGCAALWEVECMACDALVVQDGEDFAELPAAERERDGGTVPARLCGHNLSGLRSAGMMSGLAGLDEALAAAAGKRLSWVLHLVCRGGRRQAAALHGAHDDYYQAAAAGLVQLFAANVQEAVDFALIARYVAERALTPALCAQDYYDTSHSVQAVMLPSAALLERYLGRAADSIDTPTAAQRVLFGERRRRVPLLLDRDHPAGIGGVQNHDSYFRALAAQRPFFYDAVDGLLDEAMRAFGELTGRFYSKLSAYRAEDAHFLVIAQGAVLEELHGVVDYLRTEEGLKAGLLGISVLRPFPGAALSALLRGKQAVTVLERSDQPLAEDPPLLREVRAALDKALENGAAGRDAPPYSGYAAYKKISERPSLYSGIYGVGTLLPGSAELAAVFHNMRVSGTRHRCFYVGVEVGGAGRAFPYLQSLRQRLDKAYPQLVEYFLPAGESAPLPAERGVESLCIRSLAGQGALSAGNLLAQSLAEALSWQVKSFPLGGLSQSLQAVSFVLAHSRSDSTPRCQPEMFDVVLVSACKLLEDTALAASLKQGGLLVVESNCAGERLWRTLPRHIRALIRERGSRFYTLDIQTVAGEAASMPAFVEQLSLWALLGAWLKLADNFSDEEQALLREHLRERLQQSDSADYPPVEDIFQSMARGAEALRELPWQTWPEEALETAHEHEPPWPVRESLETEQSVFDARRFWHSVGYLYDSGQAARTLLDPYLAAAFLPARSSAFRDVSSYRLRVPEWLPERCSGCGLCWALCPESALPATVQDSAALIQGGMAARAGESFLQMKRMADSLAKLTRRLFGGNEYTALGPLLRDAFNELKSKLNLSDAAEMSLDAEFERLHARLQHFKIARTEVFFDAPEHAGGFLSIALNPAACTACGICVEVCPEGAFEWCEQTPQRRRVEYDNWQLLMHLPPPPAERIAAYAEAPRENAALCRLLDKETYCCLAGGDGAPPGSGAKIALHLVCAAVESAKRPHFKAHIAYLDGLIQGLEDKIQGRLTETLRINDFEDFSRRLSRLDSAELTPRQLAALVEDEQTPKQLETKSLKPLNALLHRLKQQKHAYEQGAGGGGRSTMLLVINPDEAAFWHGTYPFNPHAQPWVCHENAPAAAKGVFEGAAAMLGEEIKDCRLARLEIDQAARKDLPEKIDWRDFNERERALLPEVLVVCQADSAPWEEMNALLAGPCPLRVLVFNAEGFSAGAKQTWRLAQEHAGGAVLQATLGSPAHLLRGVLDITQQQGPALLHIYAPEARNSGGSARVAAQAEAAWRSRVFPAFSAKHKDGAFVLELEDNPRMEGDWCSEELKFRDPAGIKSSLRIPLTPAHWALGETRLRGHFKVLPAGQRGEDMKELAAYLELKEAQREGLEAYIDFVDNGERHHIAMLSGEMIEMAREAREFWRSLQKAALEKGAVPVSKVSEIQASSAPALDNAAAHAQLSQRLLELCGYTQNPEFFKQSLREFIQQGDEEKDA